MEVKIVGKEVIKPSSPSIKTFNLSFLDQQVHGIGCIKLFFFYHNTSGVVTEEMISGRTQSLKSSLSQVLTRYYPLAGKMKDIYSVCTSEDDGAEFLEARVNGTLSEYLAKPNIDLFSLQLVPTDLWETWERPLLIIQVSYFTCGGLAIGMTISHRVADIASITSFVNSWANMAVGKINKVVRPDFSGSLVFPPSDRFWGTESVMEHLMKTSNSNYVTRRFVFSASHIISLQEKAAKQGIRQPTRVQTVAAFLWRIGIKKARTEAGGSVMPSTLMMSINLRSLLPPPVCQQSFGNFLEVFTVHNHSGDIDISNLISLLKERIEKLRNTYQDKIVQGERCFTGCCTTVETMENAMKQDLRDIVNLSSWSRFPFYDADFGWGKPTWVANGCRFPDQINLMDTNDGTGIEAYLCFPEEDMDVFTNDEELLAYSTLDPSIH